MNKTFYYRISILFITVGIYFLFPEIREFFTTGFHYLQSRNFEGLKEFILSCGIWAPITSILLMTMQSVVPLVPGIVVTITNAWIFGWEWGALYSWLGALCGATLDFTIARWYGRPVVEQLTNTVWLNRTDSFFYKNGVFAVFISRLTPFFPFKVISYGAGLTTMKLSRFLFATGIGQTPAIVLYSYAGRNLTRNVSFIVLITMVCVALGIVIYYYRVKIEQYFQKWLYNGSRK